MTQNNGHYAVQGHSRSPILVPIESSLCDFLLLINTNLLPILHHFRDTAFNKSKILTFLAIPLALTPAPLPTEGFPWDDLRKLFRGCQWMAKVPNRKHCRKQYRITAWATLVISAYLEVCWRTNGR